MMLNTVPKLPMIPCGIHGGCSTTAFKYCSSVTRLLIMSCTHDCTSHRLHRHSVMSFAPCNANVLLAAVTALSAAIAFVAALHLYARCLLQRRGGVVAVAGNPHALHRPPDGYELEVISACGQAAGLDAKELGALPVFMWESSAEGVSVVAEQCAVCLGEMEDGELGRLLPACRHVFHVVCIDAWLRVSSTCPVCRTTVRTEDAAAGVSPVS